MCGILGIISSTPIPGLADRAAEALHALAHRGPDGEGLWLQPSAAVALGHRRLRVLDLSDAAAQPMVAARSGQVLTYNGEIYNHADLRRQLTQRGIPFRSSGDTETLLHWLEEFGVERLRELHGMYAFGCWHPREQQLLLARDPLGIKPLYFARIERDGGRMLLFASEVRALLATGLVPRRISRAGLHGYLAWGAVQGPGTILADVEELPPGHWLTSNLAGEVRIERFWRPAYPPASRAPSPASPQRLRQALAEAVQSHRLSDVPVGVFLSGGIDSSAITALLAANGPRPRTLSVTFPDAPGLDESRFSDAVAARFGTEHQRVAVTAAECLHLCRQALDAQDQPSADGINSYLVAWAARQSGLTVALSGLGADELFAGYPAFHDVPLTAQWLRAGGAAGQALLAALLAFPLRLRPMDRRLQKLHQLTQTPRSLAGAYACRRRIFADRQIAALMGVPLPAHRAASDEPGDWNDADALSWLEMRGYMGNTLLRDTDGMGMAHGLEIRVPFLHQPLLDWAQAQGPALRRYPKQALLDAVADDIPAECRNRPKQGFTLPFQTWLAGPLRDHVEALLTRPSSPAFSPTFLTSLWQTWLRHPEQVGWARVWSLAVLLHWMMRHGVECDL